MAYYSLLTRSHPISRLDCQECDPRTIYQGWQAPCAFAVTKRPRIVVGVDLALVPNTNLLPFNADPVCVALTIPTSKQYVGSVLSMCMLTPPLPLGTSGPSGVHSSTLPMVQLRFC
ncbi:hypothetical protein BaRGS_00002363 [Batillaria attramentaria]|uniref:Uncharacterized protein n=1 Tax=Batillaria attramentaria TaxID=370345 RepID=A0ABD0M4I3_9CAEN